jgi:hypothetical protein
LRDGTWREYSEEGENDNRRDSCELGLAALGLKLAALGLNALVLDLMGVPHFVTDDTGTPSSCSHELRIGLAAIPNDVCVAPFPAANIFAVCSASLTAALTCGILSSRQLSNA